MSMKLILKKVNSAFDILDGWWTDAGTFESLSKANELVQENPPK